MTRVSLTAKVANVDDLVCASSVSARDIRHPVWLCLRFTLSYRDVDDLLAERGLDVSYELVGRSLLKFGPLFAREFRRRRHPPLYSPLERAVLVKREVVNRHRAQESDNVRQQLLHRLMHRDFGRLGPKWSPRSRATSASAIFAVRSTRSTAPVAMALLGMPS